MPPSSEPDASDGPMADYLVSLNAAQRIAATHSPSRGCLQILAGPGSGKTRVLTCRVAWLVKACGIRPEDLVVVTFTNKAANEMKDRLRKLLGKNHERIILGTFHATCARYLRKYGQLIDLPNNFSICDATDTKSMMKNLLKQHANYLKERNLSLKAEAVLSDISKAKAKQVSPEAFVREVEQKEAHKGYGWKDDVGRAIAMLYENYQASHSIRTHARLSAARFSLTIGILPIFLYVCHQAELKDNNSLDFDDLLLYGVRLLRRAPQLVSNVQHVLVDEFQDTNLVQFDLMQLFAQANNYITIVGDPDQSIYGWRAAEVENLARMKKAYKNTKEVHLEQNYRSTGQILKAALAVVSQDDTRIDKSLYTSHPSGSPVFFRGFPSPQTEASFVATEVKRLVAHTGGMLGYNDFAILLRFNALSRAVESALQMEGIGSRMMGGHKFFERMEVKDILAYLCLADNPGFTPAFLRVVNVPKRQIGEKSVSELIAKAQEMDVPPMVLAERISEGRMGLHGAKPALRNNLKQFVDAVVKVREEAKKGRPVSELIEMLVSLIKYEEYLRKEPDFDSRWENVKELISYSRLVSAGSEGQVELPDVEEPLSAFASGILDGPVKVDQSDGFVRASPGVNRGAFGDIKKEDDGEGRKVTSQGGTIAEDFVEGPEDQNGDAKEDSASSSAQALAGTPLRIFLQASMLSTDAEANDEAGKGDQQKVTISTCHAAKGLEWPVVFVIGVEDEIFPFYKCTAPHEIREERRLLYVAMTRAATFLNLTYCATRLVGGEERNRTSSRFISGLNGTRNKPLGVIRERPELSSGLRSDVAQILGRQKPKEAVTEQVIAEFARSKTGVDVASGFQYSLGQSSASWRGGLSGPYGQYGQSRSYSSSGPVCTSHQSSVNLFAASALPSIAGEGAGISATDLPGFTAARHAHLNGTLTTRARSNPASSGGARIAGFHSALNDTRSLPPPPSSVVSRAPVLPVKAAPSFTDEYRLSASLSSGGSSTAQPAPRSAFDFGRPSDDTSVAVLKSFLPAEPTATESVSGTAAASDPAKSFSARDISSGSARRRLGMGRARPKAGDAEGGRKKARPR